MEIYAEWAGQCIVIQQILRRVQIDEGDDKVKFCHVSIFLLFLQKLHCLCCILQVKAELLDFLEDRRGKSQPTFDIYRVYRILLFYLYLFNCLPLFRKVKRKSDLSAAKCRT